MAPSKSQNLLDKVKLAISVLRYPGQVTKSEIETIEKDLAEIVKETKGKESKPLPVTSLKKKDVETLFGTKHSKSMDVSWADVSTSDFEKPKLLDEVLEIFGRTLKNSTNNEEVIRVRLNTILMFILDDVNLTRPLHARDMSFQLETYVMIDVSNKPDTPVVHGYPDYSLWYGSEEAVETNLVIVEGKAEGLTSSAEAQQLAYMSMVQKARKEMGKLNTTVYGAATDSYDFFFYHLNEAGEWSKRVFCWGEKHEENLTIVRLFAKIFREASLLSPEPSVFSPSEGHHSKESSWEARHRGNEGEEMDIG